MVSTAFSTHRRVRVADAEMPISTSFTEGSVPVADSFRGSVHSVMHEGRIRVSSKYPSWTNEEAAVRQVLPETEFERLSGRLWDRRAGVVCGVVV